jgi:DNA-binding MarR family transcriptional regulator
MPATVTERIEMLHGLIRGHTATIVRAHGLTPALYASLAHIFEFPDVAASELTHMDGVRHQTMHWRLDSLERRGLIERPGPTGPAFARRIRLSRSGTALVERCRAALLDVEHRMLARFGPPLVDTLAQCLDECAAQLQKLPRPRASRSERRTRAGARHPPAPVPEQHAQDCLVCDLVKRSTD